MNSSWYKKALYDNPSSPEERLLEHIRRDKDMADRIKTQNMLAPLFKAIGKENGDIQQIINILNAAKAIADQGKEYFNANLSALRTAIYGK